MSKAQITKEKIIQQAAELFNQKGYAGSSISDIMQATGLQKGGIYNHFKSKDELALSAFDYAFRCVRKRYLAALRGKHHAVDRLQALASVIGSLADDPPVSGGCPVLNTAIESDDTHPALRKRAQEAMTLWRDLINKIIERGIAAGEIQEVEADAVATIIISTIEGAIMMSKLYGDTVHVERAIAHLNQYLDLHLKSQ